MVNWSELPSEILNIIFLYLKKIGGDNNTLMQKDLAQCILTCRSWRLPAQKVFFSEVYLHAASDVDKILGAVIKNKNGYLVGKYAKSLRLKEGCNWTMTTLFTIDVLFPNLEKVEFSGSDLSYSIFHDILIENDQFSNLKMIPASANRNQDEMYLKCLNFIRDRVTSIDLLEDVNNSRNLYSILRNKFVDYPELKQISIRTPTSNLQLDNMMQYVNPLSDINALMSLQKLSLKSTVHGFSILFFTSSGRGTLVPTSTLKNLNIILNDNSSWNNFESRCPYCGGRSCPHCRNTGQSSHHYNPRFFSLSEEFMLFMMNKFPRLNSFRLEGKIAQFEITHNLLNEVLPQFMKYVIKIPNSFVEDFSTSTPNAIKLLENIYEAMEKDCSTTTPTRSLTIMLDFDRHKEAGWSSICFKNLRSKVHDITFSINCYSTSPNEGSTEKKQLQLIQQTGRFFHKISLKISSSNSLVTLLNYIGDNCSHLGILAIDNFKPSSDKLIVEKKNTSKNYSVNVLVLETVCLLQQNFYIF